MFSMLYLTYLPFVLSIAAAAPSANQVRHVTVPASGQRHVFRPDLFGYSIEPSSTYSYVSSPIASKLLSLISQTIGKAPPIRIGGTTADEITIVPTLNSTSGYNSTDSGSSGGNNGAATIQVAPKWYNTWSNYFPSGTDFVYCLNFYNTSGQWNTAIQEAKLVFASLGSKLKRLEFGNEVDHWASKDWRNSSWGTVEYTAQFRSLRSEIESLSEFKSLSSPPQFQAAVFADPPLVPDQNVDKDDFDIVNLTQKAGLVNDDGSISSYSVHLYPQSNCDAARKARLSVNLLSNHSVLYTNVSQYIPEQKAAAAAGAPLVFGETNSVSCGGKSGVSDTYGAALWALDYALMSASLGIEQIYFHLGDQSEYSAFTPLPYTYMNESLQAGIRTTFYSHLFVAQILAGSTGKNLTIEALPSANSSDFSGYAITEDSKLSQLVLLDMGVWNSSQGISNPSTLKATDSKSVSSGTRPVSMLSITTPWKKGTNVQAVRMQAPGTNAKSDVNISGLTIDSTGLPNGNITKETYIVGTGGLLNVKQNAADALLLKNI